jgi:transposase
MFPLTLHAQAIAPIPEETVRVAQATFPNGNLYLKMRDELGVFFSDADFAALYPQYGHCAETPWRLALISIM